MIETHNSSSCLTNRSDTIRCRTPNYLISPQESCDPAPIPTLVLRVLSTAQISFCHSTSVCPCMRRETESRSLVESGYWRFLSVDAVGTVQSGWNLCLLLELAVLLVLLVVSSVVCCWSLLQFTNLSLKCFNFNLN